MTTLGNGCTINAIPTNWAKLDDRYWKGSILWVYQVKESFAAGLILNSLGFNYRDSVGTPAAFIPAARISISHPTPHKNSLFRKVFQVCGAADRSSIFPGSTQIFTILK